MGGGTGSQDIVAYNVLDDLFFWSDGLHIRNIGEVANAITEARDLAMLEPQGSHCHRQKSSLDLPLLLYLLGRLYHCSGGQIQVWMTSPEMGQDCR